MTICESLAVQNYDVKRHASKKRRVFRQKSFDTVDDSAIFEDVACLETVSEACSLENSVDSKLNECVCMEARIRAASKGSEFNSGTRRTLSIENLANRKKERSSVILDWLTNPDNKFMYQGRSIDSRIFRSHSAIESRSLSTFAKNARFHSLRDQEMGWREGIKIGLSKRKGWICELKTSRDQGTYFTWSEVPAMTSSAFTCTAGNGNQHNPSRQARSANQNIHHDSDEITRLSRQSSDAVDFISELSADVCDLRLDKGNCDSVDIADMAFPTRKSVANSKSLPMSYGRSQEVKLRRMNSDAMFYKGGCNHCEKRRSFSSHRRRSRLSFRLRDLVSRDGSKESLDTGIHSLSSSKEGGDVNSHDIVENIDKIFTYGDLWLIRELAECGFDFNAKDGSGNCALHYAALRGSEMIVREILDNGGNVWVRNNRNQLPVEMASNMNARMLLSGVTLFYRGQYSNEIESRLTSKKMSFEL